MASDAAGTLLGVFARYWQPGEVKTRLARRVGHDWAARLHRQFLETTLQRFAGIGGEQWLAISPGEALSRLASELPAAARWRLVEQPSGDLGARMAGLFAEALTVADRVVLVGSDSPDLPQAFVAEAFAALARVPVVLGPARDGGYYLIGLNNQQNAALDPAVLFAGIPWSTRDVLPLTLERLTARGIAHHLLPMWSDVDEWEDLLGLHERLTKRDDDAGEFLGGLQGEVAAAIAVQAGELTRKP